MTARKFQGKKSWPSSLMPNEMGSRWTLELLVIVMINASDISGLIGNAEGNKMFYENA